MHNQHTNPARDAPHPFDQCSADVTLRTSDSVHFHVHAQILNQASPVFATMLKLPQPLTAPDHQLNEGAVVSPTRPIVDVAEDSKVLEPLLRLCYPLRKPELQHLGSIQPALEAAIKYDMERPTEELTARLLACAAQGPLQVWAFGCRHGLEHIARRGAEALRVSLPDGEREELMFLPGIPRNLNVLDGTSAGQYFRLLQFVRATNFGSGGGDDNGATTSRASLSSSSPVGTGSTGSLATDTHARWYSDGMTLLTPPKKATTPVVANVVANKSAFRHLPFADVKEAYPGIFDDIHSPDIICRCEDGTQFKAHQIILSLYSPILRGQIAIMNAARASSQPEPPEEEEGALTTALPVLDLEGSSGAISTLLGICYQCQLPESTSTGRRLSNCIKLSAVATKYKIQPAIDLAFAQWASLVSHHPTYSYFLARKNAIRSAAAIAATAALQSCWSNHWEARSRDCLLEMMEKVPARTYHQLSIYFDACSRAATQEVEKATKAWELTAAERSADDARAARMYKAVTDRLKCRREALEKCDVAPKADHASDVLSWSLYSSACPLASLWRNRFKDDLESLSVNLQREIDDAISKVKLDLR